MKTNKKTRTSCAFRSFEIRVLMIWYYYCNAFSEKCKPAGLLFAVPGHISVSAAELCAPYPPGQFPILVRQPSPRRGAPGNIPYSPRYSIFYTSLCFGGFFGTFLLDRAPRSLRFCLRLCLWAVSIGIVFLVIPVIFLFIRGLTFVFPV